MRAILKYPAKTYRICLGALIGTLWVCLIVCFPVLPKYMEQVITYIGISSGMIFFTFKKKKGKELLIGVLYLYLFAFCLGGICNIIYYHTRIGSLSKWIFMAFAGGGTCYVVLAEAFRIKKDTKNLYDVDLFYQGKKLSLKGLLDSGNGLYAPITRKPVSIVEYPACKDFIIAVDRIQYIPFQSVGKTAGVLVGITIDQLVIHMGKEQIEIEKPMIGLCKHTLCQDHRYHMLLHPILTEKGAF